MPTPERLLPAYESLARLIRAIVREEVAPIAEALAEIQSGRHEGDDPPARRTGDNS